MYKLSQPTSKSKPSKYYSRSLLLLTICGLLFWVNQTINADKSSAAIHEQAASINGPICRNGLYLPNPDYSPYINSSTGLDIGWFIRFGPYPQPEAFPQQTDTISMIRFKPKFDQNRRRTGDYLLGKGRDDDGSDNGIPNEYSALTFNGQQLSTHFDDGWRQVIQSRPGALWIVGNEMDRVDLQDSLYPQTYAKAYHDAYHFIKSADPTAQVAVGGLVSVSPGRLQYLDIIWDSYMAEYGHPMPVDVWTFHSYALPEVVYYNPTLNSAAAMALGTDRNLAIRDARVISKDGIIYQDSALCQLDNVICAAEVDDVDIFRQSVVRMRQWMKNHGQQQKPLILTEWSILYPLDSIDEFGDQMTLARSAEYLEATVAYLETAIDPDLGYALDGNRLVQRWNWFQPNPIQPERVGGSSIIFDEENNLTSVGLAYQNRIRAQAERQTPYVDLTIDQVHASGGQRNPQSGLSDVALEVVIRNIGNVTTKNPAVVIFRDANGDAISVGEIPAGLFGCSVYTAHFTETWYDRPAGNHIFSAEIISGDEINAHRDNNIAQGSAFAPAVSYFLPLTGTR